MRIKNGVTNYYVYGAGLLYQVTETATATNTLTYHYDYRGSTVALTDSTGTNVTDRIEYSAYATMSYRAGTNDTPFLFNGRYGVQTDANGLLNMRARYYNPYLCRFINPDPSGFAGGLNFYCYANGNPISYIDPFGLSPNWGLVGRGSLELGAGIASLVGLAILEVPSFGTATPLAAGVVFGFLKGPIDIGAGFSGVQPNSKLGQEVNSIPSNPGGLVMAPFGQNAENVGTTIWDVGSLGLGSGPEFINSINSGKNLGLNATQFGLDAYSVGSDASALSTGNENGDAANYLLGSYLLGNMGVENPAINGGLGTPNPANSSWIQSLFNQSPSSSTGKP